MSNKRFAVFSLISAFVLVYGFYIDSFIFPEPSVLRNVITGAILILFMIATVLMHKGKKRTNDFDIRYLVLLSAEGFFILIHLLNNKLPF